MTHKELKERYALCIQYAYEAKYNNDYALYFEYAKKARALEKQINARQYAVITA